MRNIKLTLQYDGTDFCGYELQPGKRSVRGEIEKALYKIFKAHIKIVSASRTDAGVHALGQIVNFHVKSSIPTAKIIAAVNSCLAEDVRVIKAEDKDEDKGFNARYNAKSKQYEYLIYNGDILPPHCRRFVWQVKPKLNLFSMRKAAKILVGKHDFSSFCAAGGDDKNFVRIIHSFIIRHSSFGIWEGVKYRVIRLQVTGNGFLYKMVRNMVGTLVEIGLGKRSVSDVRKVLHARNRRLAGRTAPAQGLCLVKINY